MYILFSNSNFWPTLIISYLPLNDIKLCCFFQYFVVFFFLILTLLYFLCLNNHLSIKLSSKYWSFTLDQSSFLPLSTNFLLQQNTQENRHKGGKLCLHSWFPRNLSPSRWERQGALCTAAGVWGLLFPWQQEKPKQHNCQNLPSITSSCQLGPISQSLQTSKAMPGSGNWTSKHKDSGDSSHSSGNIPKLLVPKVSSQLSPNTKSI